MGVREKFWLSLVMIMVMLFALGSGAWAAGEKPGDVPVGHWAYQAVQKLLDEGYLELYQDQTFRGNQPVDRYTLATVVAKLLQEASSGNAGAQREDVELLRNLSNEFRSELVDILGENSELLQKLEELFQQNQIFKEDLTNINLNVQNLQERVQQLDKEIKTTKKQQKIYIFAAFMLGALATK